MQLNWTLPFHLLYRFSFQRVSVTVDIGIRQRRPESCTLGTPHCSSQTAAIVSKVKDVITREKVGLYCSNKMQLLACLNTFLIVLLHSRFTFPILLPHTSLCGVYLMLGRIRCIRLLLRKSSIEKMVFLFCQPLHKTRNDPGKEILSKEETSP